MRLLTNLASFLVRLPVRTFYGVLSTVLYLYSLPTLAAIIAITVAAGANYAISHAMYQHWVVEYIDEMDTSQVQFIFDMFFDNLTIRENSLESIEIVRADYHRLLKMKGFWPPHENLVVTFGYSLGVYLLLTKVMLMRADYSVKPINRDNAEFISQSSLVRIMNSTIAGGFICAVLFSSYRLGEMHFAIIFMNLVHLIVTFNCSNFVFAFVLRRLGKNEKEKDS